MEFLVVSHKYPPSIGGMQKQCFELVEGLRVKHHLHELIYRGRGSNIAFLFAAAWRALRILRKERNIQFVYANDGLMAFFLTPVQWFSKVPLIATIHGLDVVFPLNLYQKWLKRYLNRYRALIAVSDATAKELKTRGIRKDIVHMVRNGFDPKSTKDNEWVENSDLSKLTGVDAGGKRVIVSIGRSVKRKGFSWFIENVFMDLPEDVIYIIIGPTLGDYRKVTRMKKWLPQSIFKTLVLLNGTPLDEIRVHKLVRTLKLEKRVFHLSSLANNEVREILERADLFVMPNIKVEGDYEGFGLVALEAVMSGTLCIASDTDGIPSAIQNDRNGLLLTPSAAPEWISRIRELLEDPDMLKNKSEEFREYTLKNCLTWDKMVMEYEQIFEKVTQL